MSNHTMPSAVSIGSLHVNHGVLWNSIKFSQKDTIHMQNLDSPWSSTGQNTASLQSFLQGRLIKKETVKN